MEIRKQQLFEDAQTASGMEITYAGADTKILVSRPHHETGRYRVDVDESTAKQLAGRAVEFGMIGDITTRPVVKLVADPAYRKRK